MDEKRRKVEETLSGRKVTIGKGSVNASLIFDICVKGDFVSLKTVLNDRKDVIKLRDRNNRNLLHYCAESKDIQCAQCLIDHSIDLLTQQDNDGYTVLHLAVISGNKLLTRFLCQKFDDSKKKEEFLNRGDGEGHTAFHWATVCSEIECLDILHEEGASPAIADNHGAYPIHYASQMCGVQSSANRTGKIGVDLLRKLLSFSTVDVNCKDNDGRTPLLWASSAGNSEAILILINAKADVSGQDNDGLTALHCASSRGYVECVETLLTLCGAEIDQMDSNGCTPLFYAVTLGHADCTRVLLQYGAEPNVQDCKGRTAAHCGASKGQLETIKIIAQQGANLWMRNVKGDLPLHEAIKSGRKELVWWLLAQQSEAVNVTNTFGKTPLHLASIQNNVEMCKVLIDSGADVNVVMKSKGHLVTPLDAALNRGYRGCAKFLLLHGALPASRLNISNRPLRFGAKESSSDSRLSEIGLSPILGTERAETELTTSASNTQTESSGKIRTVNLPAIQRRTESTASRKIQVFRDNSNSPDFVSTSRSAMDGGFRSQSIVTNVYVQSGRRTIPPLKKKKPLVARRTIPIVNNIEPTSESTLTITDGVNNENKFAIPHDFQSSIDENDSYIREDITIDLSSKDEVDIRSESVERTRIKATSDDFASRERQYFENGIVRHEEDKISEKSRSSRSNSSESESSYHFKNVRSEASFRRKSIAPVIVDRRCIQAEDYGSEDETTKIGSSEEEKEEDNTDQQHTSKTKDDTERTDSESVQQAFEKEERFEGEKEEEPFEGEREEEPFEGEREEKPFEGEREEEPFEGEREEEGEDEEDEIISVHTVGSTQQDVVLVRIFSVDPRIWEDRKQVIPEKYSIRNNAEEEETVSGSSSSDEALNVENEEKSSHHSRPSTTSKSKSVKMNNKQQQSVNSDTTVNIHSDVNDTDKSESISKTKSDSKSVSKKYSQKQSKTESESVSKNETKSVTKSKSKSVTKSTPKRISKTDSKSEEKTISKDGSKAASKNETNGTSRRKPRSISKSDTISTNTSKSQPKTQPQSDSKSVYKSEKQNVSKSDTKSEMKAQRKNELNDTFERNLEKTKTDSESISKEESKSDLKSDSKSKTKSYTKTPSKTPSKSISLQSKSELKTPLKSKTTTVSKSESKTPSKISSKTPSKSDRKNILRGDTKSEPKTPSKNEAKVTGKSSPKSDPLSYSKVRNVAPKSKSTKSDSKIDVKTESKQSEAKSTLKSETNEHISNLSGVSKMKTSTSIESEILENGEVLIDGRRASVVDVQNEEERDVEMTPKKSSSKFENETILMETSANLAENIIRQSMESLREENSPVIDEQLSSPPEERRQVTTNDNNLDEERIVIHSHQSHSNIVHQPTIDDSSSNSTQTDNANKISFEGDKRKEHSQRTSSIEESLLTETPRIDNEITEPQPILRNVVVEEEEESDESSTESGNNDEEEEEAEEASGFEQRSHGTKKLKSNSDDELNNKVTQSSLNSNREAVVKASNEQQTASSTNAKFTGRESKSEKTVDDTSINYENVETVENESGDDSSSGFYNREMLTFESETSSGEDEPLDGQMSVAVASNKTVKRETRFHGSDEYLRFQVFDRESRMGTDDATKTASKIRTDSRCSHKLHYKTNPPHIGTVNLSRVTAKVNTRGGHLLRRNQPQFDGKHKHVLRCNCIPGNMDGNEILQTMERSLRKYKVERKLFEELQNLKRCQIRTNRTTEPLMVKRLAERFRREVKVPGLQEFSGSFTYKAYEKFLYEQLRLLSISNQEKVLPLIKAVSDENISLSCIRQAIQSTQSGENTSQLSNRSRRGSRSATHESVDDLISKSDADLYSHDYGSHGSLHDISSLRSNLGHRSTSESKTLSPSSSVTEKKADFVRDEEFENKELDLIETERKVNEMQFKADLLKKKESVSKVKFKESKSDTKKEAKLSKRKVTANVAKITIEKQIEKIESSKEAKSETKNETIKNDAKQSKQRVEKIESSNEFARKTSTAKKKQQTYSYKTTAKYEQMLSLRRKYQRECLKPKDTGNEVIEASKNRPKFKRTKTSIPVKAEIHVPFDDIAERWQRIKAEERAKLRQLRKASSSVELRFMYVLSVPKSTGFFQTKSSLMDPNRRDLGRRDLLRTQSDSILLTG